MKEKTLVMSCPPLTTVEGFEREVVGRSRERQVVAVFHEPGNVVSELVLAALQRLAAEDATTCTDLWKATGFWESPAVVPVLLSAVRLPIWPSMRAAPTVVVFKHGGCKEMPVILGLDAGPPGWWLPGLDFTLVRLLWESMHRRDAFVFARVGSGEHPAVTGRYGAEGGPCLILLRGGVETSRLRQGDRSAVLKWFAQNGMDIDYGEHSI